jgi:transposase
MSEQNTLFQLPDIAKSDNKNQKGKVRLVVPNRDQIEFKRFCIDDLVPADHKVRVVWNYVKSLDMSGFISKIQSVDGNAGRPATDPHLFLALWLYATIEGIVNGRVIDRYCREHNAFIWLCGAVDVNYHSINDFKVNNKDRLNNLLTQSIAVLLRAEIITLDSVSQDGMRVRAHASKTSFKRKITIMDFLDTAREYIKSLKEEIEENPSEIILLKRKSELKKAKELEEKIQRSLEELEKVEEKKEETLKKDRKKLKDKDREKIRTSITDPEATIMKMANSGFNPAYNVQFATDTESKVIVGVDVSNIGSDSGLMNPMLSQVIDRTGITPDNWLADGGYNAFNDIDDAKKTAPDMNIIIPVKNSHLPESYIPKPTDSESVKEWRINMGTIEAKEEYKDRASTSELVNAQARNNGLQQFFVKGLEKVTSTALIFALTHNMVASWRLWS